MNNYGLPSNVLALGQLPDLRDMIAGKSQDPQSSGQPDFRDLLTILILSSFNTQTADGGESLFNAGGGGMNQLMMPLMVTLLEQLTARQVEVQPPASLPKSQPKPEGLPIKGHLTQRSHAGHIALDFGAPVGTPVHATMDGKVVYAGWNDQGYGNLVIVENGAFRTYYAHLSKVPVKVGKTISAGGVIGRSGNTGNSTGPHLHYEVRKNGRAINPTKFTLG